MNEKEQTYDLIESILENDGYFAVQSAENNIRIQIIIGNYNYEGEGINLLEAIENIKEDIERTAKKTEKLLKALR